MKNLKVIFMGTTEFSEIILRKLIEETNVVMVVTQPDRANKRGKMELNPVKKLALDYNLPLYQPEKIRYEFQPLLDINADIIITAAYGQIISKELLSLKYPSINVHGSILPKYRGGAPINRAIEYGETEMGITTMYMSEKMDQGDILEISKIPVTEADTFSIMYLKLAELGKDLIVSTLNKMLNNQLKPIKQDETQQTTIKLIKKEERYIDFNKNYIDVCNKIRSLDAKPGAIMILNNKKYLIFGAFTSNTIGEVGTIINITKDYMEIGCLEGSVKIYNIQEESRKKMSIREFFNSRNVDEFLNCKVEYEKN